MANEGNNTAELQREVTPELQLVREKVLQGDNLFRIFSFVGSPEMGGQEEFTTLPEAGRWCSQLSLVCKDWKTVFEDNIGAIVGPLKIVILGDDFLVKRLDENRIWDWDSEVLAWLDKFSIRLKIGSLKMKFWRGCCDLGGILDILRRWNMQDLKKAELNFHDGRTWDHWDVFRVFSQLYDNSISQSTVLEDVTIQLGCLFSHRTLNRTDWSPQEFIDDFIATSPLFSKTTLKRLNFSIDGHNGTFNPNRLIANLPSLTHLKLAFDCDLLAYELGRYNQRTDKAMWISSPTLSVLDVSGLQFTPVSCNCPQLERFICNLDFRCGITLPNIGTNEQYHRVWAEFGCVDDGLRLLRPGGHRTLQAKASALANFEGLGLAFLGLEVPPTCTITVKSWGAWDGDIGQSNDQGFKAFQKRFRSILRSVARLALDDNAFE